METLHLQPVRATFMRSIQFTVKSHLSPNPNTDRIRPAALEPVTMCARTRTATVDRGNPGDWHGTSATATATTVGCAIDTEVFFFHGLLRRGGLLRACTRATDDVGG